MKKRRTYLLKEEKGSFYQEYFYSRDFKKKGTLIPGRKFYLEKIKKDYQEFSSQDIFNNSLLKRLFWGVANKELKLAVFFSYFYQAKLNRSNIGNVQIKNWLISSFFRKEHEFLKKQAAFWRIFKPRSLISANLRTRGNQHIFGLRFDNIHLALDLLDQKPIYTVHWDRHPPRCFPLSWVRHKIKDC
ncbi:MAG: hypothetical protein ABIB61_04095 [Candidatus Shapirobacteria bacterium]